MKNLSRMTVLCVCLDAAAPLFGTHPGDSYFPLQIGNRWSYQDSTQRTVTDALRMNGNLYYRWVETHAYNPDLAGADTIRAEEGRVYVLHCGQEQLWFDFTLQEGASYFYTHVYAGSGDTEIWNVTVSRPVIQTTPAGTFTDCVELFFDVPESNDEEKWYSFAPGIGLVRLQYDGWGGPVLQSYSIIDSGLERPDPAALNPPLFTIHGVYPNPFNDETRIAVEMNVPGLVSMSVLDTNGRLACTPVYLNLDAGSRVIPFRSAGLSSGIYFFRLSSGRHSFNGKLVIVR
jgi:hypothetical protein